MTVKLYEQDSYIREFDATVVSCEKNNDIYEVYLDATCFFPTEGGQSCDRGTINGIIVKDVVLTDEGIKHILESELTVGEIVHGKIDWEHRFSNMQMHSGEHIFSGFANKLYGLTNVGFHLSDNSATMDYDGKLTAEDVLRLEQKANEAIWANKKIKAYKPNEEEIPKLEFRSKPKGIVGSLRLVEIEDVDLCACCAPHVASTAEVGLIKIISFDNYKGGTRLNYLCGKRAVEYYSSLISITDKLSVALNAPINDILSKTEKLKSDYSDIVFKNNELRRNNILEMCKKIERPVLFLPSEDSDLLKYAINELKNNFSGLCAVFCGDDEIGYRFIAETNLGDLTELSSILREKYNSKCGGRSNSIQGNLLIKMSEIMDFFVKYIQ